MWFTCSHDYLGLVLNPERSHKPEFLCKYSRLQLLATNLLAVCLLALFLSIVVLAVALAQAAVRGPHLHRLLGARAEPLGSKHGALQLLSVRV